MKPVEAVVMNYEWEKALEGLGFIVPLKVIVWR